jgi:hypothetical protein
MRTKQTSRRSNWLRNRWPRVGHCTPAWPGIDGVSGEAMSCANDHRWCGCTTVRLSLTTAEYHVTHSLELSERRIPYAIVT